MGRGVIPALAHTMLQSDALAVEFNEILNLVEIYAPFQPLDPAISFYAPWRTTTRDLRLNADTFLRSSNAWYLDANGIYRDSGLNAARFENSRLLMEPAGTNLCVNYNAAPDAGQSNMSINGTGTLTRVDRTAELAAAGLSDICPTGLVWRYDSPAGGSVIVNGQIGSLNASVLSGWCRKVSGTDHARIQDTYGQGQAPFENSDFERIVRSYTPTNAAARWSINHGNGDRVISEFILNSSTEGIVAESPIVTEGTAGQRAADVLIYENGFINPAQGMCLLSWQAKDESAPFEETSLDFLDPLVSIRDDPNNPTLLFFRKFSGSSDVNLRAHDGSGAIEIVMPSWVDGDMFLFATIWGPSDIQIGYNKNGAGWNWSAPLAYNGMFSAGGSMHIRYTPTFGDMLLNDLTIYDENRGPAWIEANYP